MNETKPRKTDRLRAITSLSRGLSPIDAALCERIARSALGILRRDGFEEAAAYFFARMPAIAEGFLQAEQAVFEGKLGLSQSAAGKSITKYDASARACFRDGKDDLGLRYVGVALFVLHRATTPPISPLQMLFAGDVVDRYLQRRYSPLSKQRAKCDAPHYENPAAYVRQGQYALEMATFCFASAPRHKRLVSILGDTLSTAEKLTAGYLRDVYNEMAIDKEESCMRSKLPRRPHADHHAKDNPAKAPESGHGDEPYQTAQNVVKANHEEPNTTAPDDPASAPES